jgi:hypothetical protein
LVEVGDGPWDAAGGDGALDAVAGDDGGGLENELEGRGGSVVGGGQQEGGGGLPGRDARGGCGDALGQAGGDDVHGAFESFETGDGDA